MYICQFHHLLGKVRENVFGFGKRKVRVSSANKGWVLAPLEVPMWAPLEMWWCPVETSVGVKGLELELRIRLDSV